VNVRKLCATLKRANGDARLPLIVLANSSETTSLNQVLAMGADDWIYKPIPVSILENRVARLIKRTKGEEGGLGAGKLGGPAG